MTWLTRANSAAASARYRPRSGPADKRFEALSVAVELGGAQLSSVQLMEITRLSATDRHVRAHEQAHLAAAGRYAAGGPSYTYTTGPDGRQYAVGGDVALDVSPVSGDPEATIQKAHVIEAAANAPADPSAQDRAIAAQAAMMEASAERQENASSNASSTAYGSSAEQASGTILSLLG